MRNWISIVTGVTIALAMLSGLSLVFVLIVMLNPGFQRAWFPELRNSVATLGTLGVVFGTLLLAGATFALVRSSVSQANREARERLLNEIIEWAIDIIRTTGGFSGAIKEAMRPATEREQQLFRYAHVAEVKERFMQFIGRDIRITKVGSQFSQKLQEAIATLQKDLVEYIKFLDDWQGELQISIAKNVSDKKENPEKADANVRAINKSAADVIEKATEIQCATLGRTIYVM
jgi:hypothetical protein